MPAPSAETAAGGTDPQTWDRTLRAVGQGPAPAALAARFGAEPEGLAFVRRGANLIYRMTTPRGSAYLRVVAARLQSMSEVASGVDYQAHLARCGAPVAPPLETQDGGLVASYGEGDDMAFASASGEVPGRALTRDETDEAALRRWGRALGALHQAARSYVPGPGVRFLHTDDNWAGKRAQIPEHEHLALERFDEIDAWRATLPRGRAMGVTHSDVNASNAIDDGRVVRLVDFDEPTVNWWAADVARPSCEMRHLPDSDRVRLRAAFVAGYREQAPFGVDEEADLPRFALMKHLEVFAWLEPGRPGDGPIAGGDSRERLLAELRRAFERHADAR